MFNKLILVIYLIKMQFKPKRHKAVLNKKIEEKIYNAEKSAILAKALESNPNLFPFMDSLDETVNLSQWIEIFSAGARRSWKRFFLTDRRLLILLRSSFYRYRRGPAAKLRKVSESLNYQIQKVREYNTARIGASSPTFNDILEDNIKIHIKIEVPTNKKQKSKKKEVLSNSKVKQKFLKDGRFFDYSELLKLQQLINKDGFAKITHPIKKTTRKTK
jgi:hypothetical protein